MHKPLPRELLAFVENIEFWAAAEVHPGCDRRELLATFEELAERARRMAGPDERGWLERRLQASRGRIDRRIRPRPLEDNSLSAASKARRSADGASGPRPSL